ncbi:MAG: hypothetical protein P1P90_02540 [Patescibacteria group bacterium]|nr:hypothetical protein [Patescibacteria group bacterium]
MINVWNHVKVVKDGETITFVIQEIDTDSSHYAIASPLKNKFVIVVKKNINLPANFHSDGARTEFHDMSILSAIASKLFPTDSAMASLAVQRMRFTMERETVPGGGRATTGHVIVTL